MSKTEQLLKHPNLWRAGQLDQAPKEPGIATGYADLDALLPGEGWPTAGLAEFMLASAGVGELRLLAPALGALSQQQERWIAWINPPFIPYAPALQAAGIDISKILLIHPRNHDDMLWALERAARSGSCSCVLAWPEERKLKLKDTQRLQLASKQGRTLTCLFRPQAAAAHASMAELRVALGHAPPGDLRLDILKRRGGWPVQQVCLPAADVGKAKHATAAVIQEQLELWRALQEQHSNKADQAGERQQVHIQTQTDRAYPGDYLPDTAQRENSLTVH